MDASLTGPADRRYSLLMLLAILVNLSGLFITILGPDGALYASIAKTMVQRNNYMELFAEGKDWLDKPHFPFWITALSFKLFGFSTWAYKLPAILFLLMGAGYTYLLAKDLYNKQVAWWATLILLTAEHIIISNDDVRAEPYLTGLVVGSVFHFYRAQTKRHYGHLVMGALLAALAVMTKGLFALIPIGSAIAGELLIKRRWKDLFHFRWLLAALLITVFITPELYCLYYQFDAHPEKLVFGRTGVSGIRFFFWDSQFGRFMNTGPIKGKGDPAFFLHTTLWAFLPWSVLLYLAVYNKIRQGIRQVRSTEWYTLCGAMVCFLVFSASRFQLPHYINIIFPFFAMLTAQYVWGVQKTGEMKFVRITQTVILMLLSLLAMGIHLFFRPGHTAVLIGLLAASIILVYFLHPLLKNGPSVQYILARTALGAILINFYLNLVFYPVLLRYQSGSEAAFVANKEYPGVPVVQVNDYSYALEFYLNQPLHTIQQIADTSLLPSTTYLLYAKPETVQGLPVRLVQNFDHFHVSRLTGKLINHATRHKELQQYGLYLFRKQAGK